MFKNVIFSSHIVQHGQSRCLIARPLIQTLVLIYIFILYYFLLCLVYGMFDTLLFFNITGCILVRTISLIQGDVKCISAYFSVTHTGIR